MSRHLLPGQVLRLSAARPNARGHLGLPSLSCACLYGWAAGLKTDRLYPPSRLGRSLASGGGSIAVVSSRPTPRRCGGCPPTRSTPTGLRSASRPSRRHAGAQLDPSQSNQTDITSLIEDVSSTRSLGPGMIVCEVCRDKSSPGQNRHHDTLVDGRSSNHEGGCTRWVSEVPTASSRPDCTAVVSSMPRPRARHDARSAGSIRGVGGWRRACVSRLPHRLLLVVPAAASPSPTIVDLRALSRGESSFRIHNFPGAVVAPTW